MSKGILHSVMSCVAAMVVVVPADPAKSSRSVETGMSCSVEHGLSDKRQREKQGLVATVHFLMTAYTIGQSSLSDPFSPFNHVCTLNLHAQVKPAKRG
ncbi:hypothetical protein BaRGS_00032818 [Batillaria attramentaria]|uniref:Secreted protein n=1 Tax=Batillaria attramentaria TaxID=370345 RepID=A0ABD0JM52_9CAEN